MNYAQQLKQRKLMIQCCLFLGPLEWSRMHVVNLQHVGLIAVQRM